MARNYSDVFQDDRAVDKYERVQYAHDSHSTAVNERQRRYLRELVPASFPDTLPTQHDFACGTGRGIDMLAGVVATAHGYDVSSRMIAQAEAAGRNAYYHHIAASGPVPEPAATDGPAVVTILRLLLNVDDVVRDRAIAFSARALPAADAGLLVVQNHGSRRSLRHLSRRRNANNEWYQELSDDQVRDLLDRHGFTIVERRGMAMFPRGWYAPARTRSLVRRLDTLLCRMRFLDRYAVDVLYVARRR